MAEEDEEALEEEYEDAADYIELAEGLHVYSAAVFQLATNSLAVHVTPDGCVFVLDATTLEWRSFPVAEPPKKSRKLGPAT